MATPGATQPTSRRTIAWGWCFVGLIAGEAILLLISNLGEALANRFFGTVPTGVDGGIIGVSTLLAVIAGAYIAARKAGRFGLYQGCVVAIGFIAWGAAFQFFAEAGTVASSLSSGSHQLVDLGPMNLGNVFTGDLLALFGGSVGGLLSGKNPPRTARS
ncbi:MAG: hypothetical protein JOY80_12380 [Candidatus Dormibacteraeota bacterium]|nr:hypothetical protein [Candidatus Dormibacteraeota bacterium]